jgi:3-deoxy-D-manno-octulosonic-acid transferase
MGYVLNLLYLAAILVAFPWLLYQRLRHGKYREGWQAKLLGVVPDRKGNRPCAWFHAVSVGEVILLEPILNRWRQRHPDWDCVISTTTQTGYALAKKKYAATLTTRYSPLTIFYCPLDFTWAVRRAIHRIRPNLLVLTELELWPNLIAAAKRHGAKVAVINGRLSEKSFRGYRRFGRLIASLLRSIDLLAVQNEEYKERFLALGAAPAAVTISGSIKFDGARTERHNEQTQALASLAGIEPDDIVFLAGSTQEPEEELALNVYRRLAHEFPKLRLILVPRHPERFNDVAALLNGSGACWQQRSTLSTGHRPLATGSRPRILLIDAVGELAAWWGTAQIAFVGGSLTRRGGQNMIEPAAYGAAVCFGPNTWNFSDVVQLLLSHQAAAVVHNEAELEAFVRRCVMERGFASSLGSQAKDLVLKQQGAANRTVELLNGLIEAQMLNKGENQRAAA